MNEVMLVTRPNLFVAQKFRKPDTTTDNYTEVFWYLSHGELAETGSGRGRAVDASLRRRVLFWPRLQDQHLAKQEMTPLPRFPFRQGTGMSPGIPPVLP